MTCEKFGLLQRHWDILSPNAAPLFTIAADRRYGAHVHFAIHKGPYATDTRWVCGYVDPQVFKSGEHGWLDPQQFLKQK